MLQCLRQWRRFLGFVAGNDGERLWRTHGVLLPDLGISMRMTWSSVNPKEFNMMFAKVVRPLWSCQLGVQGTEIEITYPLGTDERKALNMQK